MNTHEHLIEKSQRLSGALGRFLPSDDWTYLFTGSVALDLGGAGMSDTEWRSFLGPDLSSEAKYQLVAPYWDRVQLNSRRYLRKISTSPISAGAVLLMLPAWKQKQANSRQRCRHAQYNRLLFLRAVPKPRWIAYSRALDFAPVEPIYGHACIARRGIARKHSRS